MLVDGDKRCGCSAGHATFGACLRAKNIWTPAAESHATVSGWDRTLDDFDKCVDNGIVPETTRRPDVNVALKQLRAQKD